MDRTTDLTLEALVAREGNILEALDHFHDRNRERDGFAVIGVKKAREIDWIIAAMTPADRPEEFDCFETYRVWLDVFGVPHPNHVRADPYSFMWGGDTDCDRCGKHMTPLNRPTPCFGACTECELDMSETGELGIDDSLEFIDAT